MYTSKIKSRSILSIMVIVLMSLLLIPTTMVKANPDWYNTDWLKRVPITIDNSSGGALNDYQIKVSVIYDADMLPNFDDLRFTDSDEVSELSYWIQEKTDSTEALVWVKVPSIAVSSVKTIYMYYGNPTAVSASNGDNTFIFFDDFGMDGALDPAKWDVIKSTGATVDWSSEEYVAVSSSGNDLDWQIRTAGNNETCFIAEYKLEVLSFSGSAMFINRVFDESDGYLVDSVSLGSYAGNPGSDGTLSTGVRWFKIVLGSDGWDTDSRTSWGSSWTDWRNASWDEDLVKPSLWHNCGTAGFSAALSERWYYYFHRECADTEPSITQGSEEGQIIPIVTVGGEVYPVNKVSVLVPWVVMAAVIVAGGVFVIRRRTSI